MKFEWEDLHELSSGIAGNATVRAKVFGGWIVHHTWVLNKNEIAESMVFVPDPNHEWVIDK